MELHQLEYFRTLAHIKHFTNASKAIAVSQPALSRSIAKLEAELGVQLFDRSDKQLELTAAGKKFLFYVEKGLHQLDLGRRTITSSSPDNGIVRLSFIQSLGGYFVPNLLCAFREEHPNISFSLNQDDPMNLGEQLRDGKTDLCLCSAMVPVERVGWMYLCSEELYLVVHRKHPLASRQEISLQDIDGEPFIVLEPQYNLRVLTDQFFDLAGVTPNIIFEGADVFSVAGLVRAKLGITLLPKIPALCSPELVFLPISFPVCQRAIGIAWNTASPLSESATIFQRFILNKYIHQEQ